MPDNNVWLLASIGLVAGTINGLLGIGGGTILIPGMVYLLGVQQHQAHATSLLIVLPTSLISLLVYHAQGNIQLKPVLGLAIAYFTRCNCRCRSYEPLSA